ncbi:hypothetical protein C2E23DRAFT_887310 [Lenzites betulinus]|nr:hypothetical protein C2E23DRAFT_887310 [Lenzites betulinus]
MIPERQPTVHDLSYAEGYDEGGYDDDEDEDEDEEDEEALVIIPSVGSSRSAQPTSHGSNALALPAGSSLSEVHQKALYEAQLALQLRDERIRQLEIQNAQAKQDARQKRSTKGKGAASRTSQDRSEGSNIDKELAPLEDTIKRYGRKYSACCRPWPPPDQVWEFSARPDVNPQDPQERYPSTGTAEQKSDALVSAYAAELYDLLPSLLRPHLSNRWFIREFKHSIRDQKSKALANARVLRKKIFTDLPELTMRLFEDMEGNAQAISTDPILTKWRSVPEDIYPPIIFPKEKGGQMKYIFRCAAIANFTRVTLLGKGALPKNGKFRPRSNTSAKQWDVNTVSPGMIAFAAVAVRYLISLEADFDHVGATSGVNYEYLFDQYTKLLWVSWESPRIVQTRAWLDEQVFKGLTNAPTPAAAPSNSGVRTYVELNDLDELNDPGSASDTTNADSELVAFAAPPIVTPSPYSIGAYAPADPHPSAPQRPLQSDVAPPPQFIPPPPPAVVPTPRSLPLSAPLPTALFVLARSPQPIPAPIQESAPPSVPPSAPPFAPPSVPLSAPPTLPPSAPSSVPLSESVPPSVPLSALPPTTRPRPRPRPVHRDQPLPSPTPQLQDDFDYIRETTTAATAAPASQYGVEALPPASPSDLSGTLADSLHRVSLAGNNDLIAHNPVEVATRAKPKRGRRGGLGRGRGAIETQEPQLEEADPAAFEAPIPRRRTTRTKK